MTIKARVYAVTVFTALTFVGPYSAAQSLCPQLVRSPSGSNYKSSIIGRILVSVRGRINLRNGQTLSAKDVLTAGKQPVQILEKFEKSLVADLATVRRAGWPRRIKAAMRSKNEVEVQKIREEFLRSESFMFMKSKILSYQTELTQASFELTTEIRRLTYWLQELQSKTNLSILENSMGALIQSRLTQIRERLDLLSDSRRLLEKMVSGQGTLPDKAEGQAALEQARESYQRQDDFLYWWYVYPNLMFHTNYSLGTRFILDPRWGESGGGTVVDYYERNRVTENYTKDLDRDGIPDNVDKWVDVDGDLRNDRTSDPLVDANGDGIRDTSETRIDTDRDGVNDRVDPLVETHETTEFATDSYDSSPDTSFEPSSFE